MNIGELNLKNGNWDNAKKFLEDSLEIAKKLAPISTVSVLENLGELSVLEDNYSEAIATLEHSMIIIKVVGAKPIEIRVLEKFGDVYLSKYIAGEKAEIKDLESAENSYLNAFKLAQSLEIPICEATTARGFGIVASKRGDIEEFEKYFHKSFEILRTLEASFELQKTTLEYAKVLCENDNLFEAEILAKSVAFDSQKSKNYELLRRVYLLLGDIAVKKADKYNYYLKSLETARFNSKIYVRNCYHLIFRMQKMNTEDLIEFIPLLKGQNDEKYFDLFLEELTNKVKDKEYKTGELPRNLAQELEKFETIPVSIL